MGNNMGEHGMLFFYRDLLSGDFDVQNRIPWRFVNVVLFLSECGFPWTTETDIDFPRDFERNETISYMYKRIKLSSIII